MAYFMIAAAGDLEKGDSARPGVLLLLPDAASDAGSSQSTAEDCQHHERGLCACGRSFTG